MPAPRKLLRTGPMLEPSGVVRYMSGLAELQSSFGDSVERSWRGVASCEPKWMTPEGSKE